MTNLLAGIGLITVGVAIAIAIGLTIDFCRLVGESFAKIERLAGEQDGNDLDFFEVRCRLKALEDKMAELVKGEAD